MTPLFFGKVKNNKVIFEKVDLLNGYLISLEGKDIEIIIRKRKKNRTISQNSWYWSCVVGIAAEHFGYEPDEMHEAYKFMFLRKHAEGKPETVRSTVSLTTVEFSSYVEKCRQFCAEEGIVIPDPGEIDLEPTPEPEHLEPTKANIKAHQEQLAKDTEARKSKPVDIETLDNLFGWAGIGTMTEARIIEISKREFNKEPRDLSQQEAEALDTILTTEINK